MTPDELKRYASGITKTGFVLENSVVHQLKDAGWTVISNRYYEDDQGGTVREIDVLAYRVTKGAEFDVYTCLIVSCKKSDANVWAFLSRDLNPNDPNSDWWPVHAWSNVKALDYQLSVPTQPKRYHAYADGLGVTEALRLPEVEVFAFQEMSRANGAPQNQSNIFGALTTLLKSQAYEMGSLARRKTSKCVYQFNLISIVESDIVRLKTAGDVVTPQQVSGEHLISSYILKGRHSYSRVRFLTADGFTKALPEYLTLHTVNSVWYESLNTAFYDKILWDPERRKVFADEFMKELRWRVGHRIFAGLKRSADVRDIWFSFLDSKTIPMVNFSGDELDEKVSEFLSTDKETRDNVAAALKKVYRYDGEFTISADDIPF